MKTTTINGKSVTLCENCEKPFCIGDLMTTLTKGKEIGEFGYYLDIDLFPYIDGSKVKIDNYDLYHDDCYQQPKEIKTLDSFKETVNQLTKEEIRSLYLFLYNAHGCRI